MLVSSVWLSVWLSTTRFCWRICGEFTYFNMFSALFVSYASGQPHRCSLLQTGRAAWTQLFPSWWEYSIFLKVIICWLLGHVSHSVIVAWQWPFLYYVAAVNCIWWLQVLLCSDLLVFHFEAFSRWLLLSAFICVLRFNLKCIYLYLIICLCL